MRDHLSRSARRGGGSLEIMKMTLMGCTDHLGGVTSAISTALMPSAHTSTCQSSSLCVQMLETVRRCASILPKMLVQRSGCALTLNAHPRPEGCTQQVWRLQTLSILGAPALVAVADWWTWNERSLVCLVCVSTILKNASPAVIIAEDCQCLCA